MFLQVGNKFILRERIINIQLLKGNEVAIATDHSKEIVKLKSSIKEDDLRAVLERWCDTARPITVLNLQEALEEWSSGE